MLLPNSSIVDDVGQLCNKGQYSTKLKFVDESSVDSMGLTSGIRKVITIQIFGMPTCPDFGQNCKMDAPLQVFNMVKAFKEKKLSEQSQIPTRKRSRLQKK